MAHPRADSPRPQRFPTRGNRAHPVRSPGAALSSAGAVKGQVHKVPPELGGKRLDDLLVRLFDAGTRERAAVLVRQGRVQVDGRRLWRETESIPAGARLALSGSARPKDTPGSRPTLGWLHVDEALVVLDKPAGMLVQPTPKETRGTVANALLERFGPLAEAPKGERAGLVHRLDRETSGLLLAARTRAAQLALMAAFRERSVQKRYLALVHGVPRDTHFAVELNLAPSADQPDVQRTDARGAEAETDFVVLERFPNAADGGRSLVECRPRTGRRHQIRVHLQAAGHPIVGDKIYRPAGASAPSRELARHGLHAAGLEFRHPSSGRPMAFEAPLPTDMQDLLSRWKSGSKGPAGPGGRYPPSP